MPTRSKLLAALAAAALSGLAAAQLVTPPPATNPAIDANIPKAPPPAPAPPPPSAPPVRATAPKKEPIPALPYKEWEKDAHGVVLPLSEPLELAALRRNPYMTSEMMAKMEAYVPERTQSMQRVLIDNLDLTERIEIVFANVQLASGDKAGIGEVIKVTKPLNMTRLAQDLKNRGIIDDKASGFNSQITSAYDKASTPPAAAGADAEANTKRVNDMLRNVLRNNNSEQIVTYNDLLLDAAAEFPSIKPNLSREEKIAAVKKEMSTMTLDQRKDLLRKVAGLTKQ